MQKETSALLRQLDQAQRAVDTATAKLTAVGNEISKLRGKVVSAATKEEKPVPAGAATRKKKRAKPATRPPGKTS
jgi:predicted  nucleic acid-binding Zn-ribbon protein